MYLLFDIGGTNLKFGISDTSGKLLLNDKVKIIENITSLLKNVTEDLLKQYSIQGAGISVAANVNSLGIVTNSTNLALSPGFSFRDFFNKHFNINAHSANDGTCAALALKNNKKYSELNDFCAVTLGTGIGGGIVVNNQILLTGTGLEGEIGHISISHEGRPCSCGKRGCLEAYCGASGIIDYFNEYSDYHADSVEKIAALAAEGDIAAIDTIKKTGEILGRGFANISDILGTDAFLVGGGIANTGDLLFSSIRKSLKKMCFGRNIGIIPSVIKVDESEWLSLKGAYFLCKMK